MRSPCALRDFLRVQVLQYRTHQSNELKLMDSWNYVFLKLATAKNPEPLAFAAELGQTNMDTQPWTRSSWHADALMKRSSRANALTCVALRSTLSLPVPDCFCSLCRCRCRRGGEKGRARGGQQGGWKEEGRSKAERRKVNQMRSAGCLLSSLSPSLPLSLTLFLTVPPPSSRCTAPIVLHSSYVDYTNKIFS